MKFAYRALVKSAYGDAGMEFFFVEALKKTTEEKWEKETEALHQGTPTKFLLTLGADKLSGSDQKKLCGFLLAGDLKGIKSLF